MNELVYGIFSKQLSDAKCVCNFGWCVRCDSVEKHQKCTASCAIGLWRVFVLLFAVTVKRATYKYICLTWFTIFGVCFTRCIAFHANREQKKKHIHTFEIERNRQRDLRLMLLLVVVVLWQFMSCVHYALMSMDVNKDLRICGIICPFCTGNQLRVYNTKHT